MESISFSETKAHLSEIMDRVEGGAHVTIMRRGKPIAEISPVTKRRMPLDIEAIWAEVQKMPMSDVDSVDIIREMRDSGY